MKTSTQRVVADTGPELSTARSGVSSPSKKFDVVEADHRDILGDPIAHGAEFMDHAERHAVVLGEYRAGLHLASHQLARRRSSQGDGKIPDELGTYRGPGLCDGVDEARATHLRFAILHECDDVPEGAVAKRKQMFRRILAGL